MFFFFLMIRRPPRSTQSRSSAASDVYKRQALLCADCISCDRHRLDNGVWVSLEDTAIHECSRITLVAITDHVLRGTRRLSGSLPLEPGRESCSTTAAQTRVDKNLDN